MLPHQRIPGVVLLQRRQQRLPERTRPVIQHIPAHQRVVERHIDVPQQISRHPLEPRPRINPLVATQRLTQVPVPHERHRILPLSVAAAGPGDLLHIQIPAHHRAAVHARVLDQRVV
ncbi:hypothetical protein, partial [Kribbella sp. NPDC004536]|uniref:hypothetical protein n=1 Tax=Kribbella sp. NPDC004536 TaxID=3364106 RepID=UPI0036C5D83F